VVVPKSKGVLVKKMTPTILNPFRILKILLKDLPLPKSEIEAIQ